VTEQEAPETTEETPAPEAPEIKLGRVGHLFSPTSAEGAELEGMCQTALVVSTADSVEGGPTVTVANWDANGAPYSRVAVKVGEPAVDAYSFHLNRDCPWKR
jgi:hypothetical protein